MHPDVVAVEWLGGTELILTFAGGQQRRVDIARLTRFSGVFEPLQDQGYFGQVRVNREIGTIVWPNGADLCPDVLFEMSDLVSVPAKDSRPKHER